MPVETVPSGQRASSAGDTNGGPLRPGLVHRAAAEGIAAFALVFVGCGAVVANAENDGALGAVGVSLVFGLVIMVMVYATGHRPHLIGAAERV